MSTPLLNPAVAAQMTNASWIRKMFEAGRELSRRVAFQKSGLPRTRSTGKNSYARRWSWPKGTRAGGAG